MEKQRLMNVYVNNLTMMESVNRIHDMIREKQTSYVVEVNVDVVMKMEKDPYLKKISDEADLTLVDGQPLVWISKMKEIPLSGKRSPVPIWYRSCLTNFPGKTEVYLSWEVWGILRKKQQKR